MAESRQRGGGNAGKKSILELRNEYTKNRLPLAAAAIAFYLVLSMIPLLLLLVSVAAFFISPAQAEVMVNDITNMLGPGIGDALRGEVLSVVQDRGLLTGVSLILGAWSGSQVFVFMEMAFNQIWDSAENRSFIRQRLIALGMLLFSGLLFLLAIAAVSLVHVIARVQLPVLGEIGKIPLLLNVVIGFLLPAVIVSIIFAVFYRYLSTYRPQWRVIWPGAIIAAIIWVLMLQVLSWYAANFANYQVLYGSLGGLILIMLWFNYSSQIMLLGGEIATLIERRRNGGKSEGNQAQKKDSRRDKGKDNEAM